MDGSDLERHCRERGLSPEETGRICDEYDRSISEDRALLDQIEHNRKKKRNRNALIFLSGLLVLSLAFTFLFSRGRSADPVGAEGQAVDALPTAGPELDALIGALETKLRKPGRAEDHIRLSRAYRARFESQGNDEDLLKAVTSSERAKTAIRKREAVMQKSPMLFLSIFLILIIGLVGLTVMLIYNSLASRDEMVDARWSQVETVLQRRLDLIPNLVETVKGYARHEAETLSSVTEARGRMVSALGGLGGKAPAGSSAIREIQIAQQGLGSALGRLLAVVENYPDLKASQNFISLQDQLEGTENRIAVERMRYNESVRSLNARLRLFPYNVIGTSFGFEPRAYFESDSGAEKSPGVNF
jgi:LemA protein